MSQHTAVRKLKGSKSNQNLIFLLSYKPPKSNKDKTNFYKYIVNKRRVKESLHPLLQERGSIGTKDEEKAEILDAFISSSLWQGCPKSTQHPELEKREEEQNEAPIIQVEMVGNLASSCKHHLTLLTLVMHVRFMTQLQKKFSLFTCFLFHSSLAINLTRKKYTEQQRNLLYWFYRLKGKVPSQ